MNIEKINSITNEHRLIKDRIKALEKEGFNVHSEVRMGSGGVGQVKHMRDKSTRVQISHGHGRCNYAHAVIF